MYIQYIEKTNGVCEINQISDTEIPGSISLDEFLATKRGQRLDMPVEVMMSGLSPLITYDYDLTDHGRKAYLALLHAALYPYPRGYKNHKRCYAPSVSFHFLKSNHETDDRFAQLFAEALLTLKEYDPCLFYQNLFSRDLQYAIEILQKLISKSYWTDGISCIGHKAGHRMVSIVAFNTKLADTRATIITIDHFKAIIESGIRNCQSAESATISTVRELLSRFIETA